MLANCGGYGNFRSEMAAIIASKLRGNNQNFYSYITAFLSQDYGIF